MTYINNNNPHLEKLNLKSMQSNANEPIKPDAEEIIETAIKALKEGDDGAHWTSEVIEAARQLYATDKPLFQRKRSELKKASKDAQITDWMREIKGGSGEQEDSTKADELVNLVKDKSELFHCTRGIGYATFEHNGHVETWSTGSKGFIDWLSFMAYSELGFSPSETTLKQVIAVLNGIAKYEGEEYEVYLRCAPYKDGYIVDLTNEQWQAVKITPSGREVINNPPVKFIRSSTATALPIPANGNLNLLWKHVNITIKQRPLAIAFLLEAWRPDTPFVILSLNGEQGSAKSSTHKRLRQLSDPNAVPLRVAPKSTEDMYVSASNNWMASFENMSNLSANMQDGLCTLCTGGGFAARKLYSDSDESTIEVKRPAIINSIVNVITRPDAIDRTVSLWLPPIKDANKKRDAELDLAFEKDLPAILGGLFDLFSATLRELPNVDIKEPPRMIDFSYLGEAILKSAGEEVSFNTLYKTNRSKSLISSLESSPAALAVLEMAKSLKSMWTGTFKSLKAQIETHHHQEGEGWPKSPKGLSAVLRRMLPALREAGVTVRFTEHGRDGNYVEVSFSQPLFRSENNVQHVHMFTAESERERVDVVNVKNETKKNHKKEHTNEVDGFYDVARAITPKMTDKKIMEEF